jgi:hypothetical protein
MGWDSAGYGSRAVTEACAEDPDRDWMSDEVVIANHLLQDTGDPEQLLVDEAQRDALAADLAPALAAVREFYPPAQGVGAPPFPRVMMIVGVTGQLAEDVTVMSRQTSKPLQFRTRNGDFNKLLRDIETAGSRLLAYPGAGIGSRGRFALPGPPGARPVARQPTVVPVTNR